jgi:uncharacterized protein (DUF305 family)
MRELSLIAMCVLTASCVTIPNVEHCTVAGEIGAGAICSETQTDRTRDMDFYEFIEFLHAGAVCMSEDDFHEQKGALEIACRKLGKRCSAELQQEIKNMTKVSRKKVTRHGRLNYMSSLHTPSSASGHLLEGN